jgi:hypothetical protein
MITRRPAAPLEKICATLTNVKALAGALRDPAAAAEDRAVLSSRDPGVSCRRLLLISRRHHEE